MRSLRLQPFNSGFTCDALMLYLSNIVLINWRSKFEDKKTQLSLQSLCTVVLIDICHVGQWVVMQIYELFMVLKVCRCNRIGSAREYHHIYNDKVYVYSTKFEMKRISPLHWSLCLELYGTF